MSYFHWKYNQLSSALRRFTVLFGNVLLSLEIQPTIIGAKAFHCPVRNGKEWDHPAMVARLSLLSDLFFFKQTRRILFGSTKRHGLCLLSLDHTYL